MVDSSDTQTNQDGSGPADQVGITFLPDHICTPDDLCRYLIDRYGDGTVLIKPETSRLLLVDLLKTPG